MSKIKTEDEYPTTELPATGELLDKWSELCGVTRGSRETDGELRARALASLHGLRPEVPQPGFPEMALTEGNAAGSYTRPPCPDCAHLGDDAGFYVGLEQRYECPTCDGTKFAPAVILQPTSETIRMPLTKVKLPPYRTVHAHFDEDGDIKIDENGNIDVGDQKKAIEDAVVDAVNREYDYKVILGEPDGFPENWVSERCAEDPMVVIVRDWDALVAYLFHAYELSVIRHPISNSGEQSGTAKIDQIHDVPDWARWAARRVWPFKTDKVF